MKAKRNAGPAADTPDAALVAEMDAAFDAAKKATGQYPAEFRLPPDKYERFVGQFAERPKSPQYMLRQVVLETPAPAPAVSAEVPRPSYAAFLAQKGQCGPRAGFEPLWLPDALHDFQRLLCEWLVRQGRAALFADCGLGKTLMQLVWAENVVRHTNRPVLLLAPLAVGRQIAKEGGRFGVECFVSRDGKFPSGARVVVANYERLHLFDPSLFAGVDCDESSVLKNYLGKRRAEVTEFMRRVPYRLLATATAAPNDYAELGTSSEALGELGHQDMLGKFFVDDSGTSQGKRAYGQTARWRFRGHAEVPFWRWVCSWARAVRRPSDLGCDDGPYTLPGLSVDEHVVVARTPQPGRLFDGPAVTMDEQREEQRRTIQERCERAAELLEGDEPGVAWCHLNPEGELLRRLIPGSEEVAGSDKDERKEEILEAFAAGQVRVLVTKPKVAGFGLNWQHCARMSFFPSHSFEQYYQAVRRCWRFGQTRPVRVGVVASEGMAGVAASLKRKAHNADVMFGRLVELMNDPLAVERLNPYRQPAGVPSWLTRS